MLEWAFTHAEFKTQLFRFVDVFPRCRDAERRAPAPVGVLRRRARCRGPSSWGSTSPSRCRSAASSRRRSPAATSVAWPGSSSSAEDAQGAVAGLRRLWDQGEAITVDLLGERVVSDDEAQRYADRVLELVDVLSAGAPGWPARERARARSMGRAPTSRRLREAHRALAALRTPHGRGGARRGHGADASGPRPCARRRGHGPPRHRARRGEGPRVRAAPANGPRPSRRAAGLRGPGLPEGFVRRPPRPGGLVGDRPRRSHCASAW